MMAAGVAGRDQTRQHQQQTAAHAIAFVAYVSIHLQDGSQQGKRDIKTTRRVCYLVCSQDRADGDPSSAASVVLLPSDATGHPELALALRSRGKRRGRRGSSFSKNLLRLTRSIEPVKALGLLLCKEPIKIITNRTY